MIMTVYGFLLLLEFKNALPLAVGVFKFFFFCYVLLIILEVTKWFSCYYTRVFFFFLISVYCVYVLKSCCLNTSNAYLIVYFVFGGSRGLFI